MAGKAQRAEVLEMDERYEMDVADQEDTSSSMTDAPVSGDAEAGLHTVASRERIRRQMEADVEAFLARGGAIHHVDPHVMVDPPRRPVSAYGSRPI